MRLKIKVKPKAKEDRVECVGEGCYKVWVKAAPEKGRANVAVIRALSEHLNIPKARISIFSGHKSGEKVVEIAGA